MTADQLTVFGVLAAALAMFVWNRWRYDVVALMALLVVALAGIVPPGEVFAGLGHPAVVTVAAVLVISRGLLNAGVVDMLAARLTRVGDKPWLQVTTLTAIVAVSSGFINDVGALALFMPVAIWMSRKSGRSPSLLLMPLAFGSLLGGLLTLIGTPPNIIIATYRAETGAPPFEMFDYLPVGAGIALGGLLFIAIVGWRLTPKRAHQAPDDLFEISAYLTELRVPAQNRFVGRTLHELLETGSGEAEALLAGGIFVLALTAIAFDFAPPATALVGAVLVMVLTGLIRPADVYTGIDMPVIILLAAMLPVGQALETTGGSALIANWLLETGRGAPPAATLALLMGSVMLLSNVVNNAAAAVLAAPVAVNLAEGLGASVDPFLMAVAIGASCAFLTPIGHQSNMLVMEPGGYRFGDYWRLGLPLSLLVIAMGVPLLLWIWPL